MRERAEPACGAFSEVPPARPPRWQGLRWAQVHGTVTDAPLERSRTDGQTVGVGWRRAPRQVPLAQPHVCWDGPWPEGGRQAGRGVGRGCTRPAPCAEPLGARVSSCGAPGGCGPRVHLWTRVWASDPWSPRRLSWAWGQRK